MPTSLSNIQENPIPQNNTPAEVEHPYLATAFSYLQNRITDRLERHFGNKENANHTGNELLLPEDTDTSPLANFVRHYNFTAEELTLLLIALAPHVVPGFFDSLIQPFLPKGGDFPEFGGVKGQHHRGMLPTGETALFILAGTDVTERLHYIDLFDENRVLFKHNILSLESVRGGEPALSGKLTAEPEFVEVFTTGKVRLPKMSINFPAQHLVTEMEWDDLVLNERTLKQVKELEGWIRHNYTLMHEWEMDKKLKPGYRVLFYGPPGTGKTLTATLLGRYTGRHVFRIDLSMVVSKYIGETEKNLAALFDKAEHKDWILFFDEADSIFGKRTGVRDAHDKYANQEVSYLLQRIEMHSGLIILASNFRGNIDDAFIRRFNSIIYFPSPGEEERLLLWEKSFPATADLTDDVDLPAIAANYELTGSHIMNIVHYLCLEALENGTSSISNQDIIKGIRRELEKEGK